MKRFILFTAPLLLLLLQLQACAQKDNLRNSKSFKQMNTANNTAKTHKEEIATFGAGCYWCTEAQFQLLKGVSHVESGFSGGHVDNPTYKEVCNGTTGHAEVCNVYYDPAVITFDELLAAFWTCHDPTTLNRQGNDVGTQYRSVVFWHNDEQREKAEMYKRRLNEEKAFGNPIVTEIAPFRKFYIAEDYHQNYYNDNKTQPYCQFVVGPKVDKFKKVFAGKLK
ncbi:MAG: peptide-methionine (S)-S-oxide reductase MsrA [Flavipsychrobacter sp.]|nr:peptide-methionine (S)-S-oxide reductase MsrA [Flavipsychrobacter sp.]